MNGITSVLRSSLVALGILGVLLTVPAVARAGSGIDRSFADKGIQSLNLGGIGTDRDSSKLIDTTGSRNGSIFILSGGRYGARRLEVAKFLPDGRLDPSFGLEGVAFVNFEEKRSVTGGAIAIDTKGRILIAGTTNEDCGTHGCSHRIGLLRLDRRGNFDPSFRRGKLYKGPAGTGQGLVLLPKGKILVAGNDEGDFNVSRFGADGSLDRSFGRSGVGIAEAESRGSGGNTVSGITLDRKGRIVVVASTGRGRGYVGRFKPTGRADRSFGTAGVFQSGKAAGARGVEVLKSGRIVTAHSDEYFDGNCASLFALKANGAIDTAFNNASAAAANDTCNEEVASSVDGLGLDRNGKLTVIGSYDRGQFTAQKFNDDGSRITSYGVNGTATFPDGQGQVIDGFVDEQGRVVAVGGARGVAGRVGRFTVNGSPDTSFATGGTATYALVGPSDDSATQVFNAGNGILIAGKTNAGTRPRSGSEQIAITRLKPNGKPDRRFADRGRLLAGFLSSRRPLVGYSGKNIFVGSRVEIINGDDYYSYFTISKYNADGSPAASYGAGGSTPDGTFDRLFPEYILPQPDGGVIIVDQTRGGAKLARVTPSGRLDSNFGTDGISNIRIPHDSRASLRIEGVAIDRKGLPVLAFSRGVCRPNLCGTNELVVARYGARGRPDPGFGTSGQVETKAVAVDALAVSPGGGVVVAGLDCPGGFRDKCPKRRFVLSLNRNGRPDSGFGRRGRATSPVRDMKVTSATSTRSGSVVLTGDQAGRPALLGFRKNGRPATGWGKDGLIRLSKGLSGSLDAISTAPGGKLVAAGTLRTSDQADNFLAVGLSSP